MAAIYLCPLRPPHVLLNSDCFFLEVFYDCSVDNGLERLVQGTVCPVQSESYSLTCPMPPCLSTDL